MIKEELSCRIASSTVMDFHDEPSSVRGLTVTDLKEALPDTGFRLRGPFFHSLICILSLSEDGSGGRLDRESSSTCGFNSRWSPIDLKTSSVRCSRALNLLKGRLFSAIIGSSLDPPPCPVDAPGCIGRKGPPSSDAGRDVSTGHPSSEFSRISTIPYLEVAVLEPSSPKHGKAEKS